jgi:hypothetical protein
MKFQGLIRKRTNKGNMYALHIQQLKKDFNIDNNIDMILEDNSTKFVYDMDDADEELEEVLIKKSSKYVKEDIFIPDEDEVEDTNSQDTDTEDEDEEPYNEEDYAEEYASIFA